MTTPQPRSDGPSLGLFFDQDVLFGCLSDRNRAGKSWSRHAYVSLDLGDSIDDALSDLLSSLNVGEQPIAVQVAMPAGACRLTTRRMDSGAEEMEPNQVFGKELGAESDNVAWIVNRWASKNDSFASLVTTSEARIREIRAAIESTGHALERIEPVAHCLLERVESKNQFSARLRKFLLATGSERVFASEKTASAKCNSAAPALTTRVFLGQDEAFCVLCLGSRPLRWKTHKLVLGDEATGIVQAIAEAARVGGELGFKDAPCEHHIHGRKELQRLIDVHWMHEQISGSVDWVETPAIAGKLIAEQLSVSAWMAQDDAFNFLRQSENPVVQTDVVPWRKTISYASAAGLICATIWFQYSRQDPVAQASSTDQVKTIGTASIDAHPISFSSSPSSVVVDVPRTDVTVSQTARASGDHNVKPGQVKPGQVESQDRHRIATTAGNVPDEESPADDSVSLSSKQHSRLAAKATLPTRTDEQGSQGPSNSTHMTVLPADPTPEFAAGNGVNERIAGPTSRASQPFRFDSHAELVSKETVPRPIESPPIDLPLMMEAPRTSENSSPNTANEPVVLREPDKDWSGLPMPSVADVDLSVTTQNGRKRLGRRGVAREKLLTSMFPGVVPPTPVEPTPVEPKLQKSRPGQTLDPPETNSQESESAEGSEGLDSSKTMRQLVDPRALWSREKGMELTGIVKMGGSSWALINGKKYGTGDWVTIGNEKAQVILITNDYITLRHGNRDVRLLRTNALGD